MLLAAVVLNLGTLHSWGFYTPWAFAAVIAALVLGAIACAIRSPSESPFNQRERKALVLLTSASACLLGVFAASTFRLYYVDYPSFLSFIRFVNKFALASIGLIFVCFSWMERVECKACCEPEVMRMLSTVARMPYRAM